MGIKRLKKVFIIKGAKNSGKTHCIKEIARQLKTKGFDKYEDLLQTVAGWFLNQNPENEDMNDDIFGYLSNDFDRIGIISAGDNKKLLKQCLSLLLEFQPDIIVCAENDEISGSAKECIEERYKLYNNNGKWIQELFAVEGKRKHTEGENGKELYLEIPNKFFESGASATTVESIVNQIVDEIRCFTEIHN